MKPFYLITGLVLLNKNDVKDDLSVQFVQPSPLTIMMCLKIVDRFQKSDLSPLVPDSKLTKQSDSYPKSLLDVLSCCIIWSSDKDCIRQVFL